MEIEVESRMPTYDEMQDLAAKQQTIIKQAIVVCKWYGWMGFDETTSASPCYSDIKELKRLIEELTGQAIEEYT